MPNTPTQREELLTLTKDINCEWCGAKPGEPCKIQIPLEGQIRGHYHPSDYRFGNDKTYFPQEVIHLCRSK